MRRHRSIAINQSVNSQSNQLVFMKPISKAQYPVYFRIPDASNNSLVISNGSTTSASASANLKFDGTTLDVSGNVHISNNLDVSGIFVSGIVDVSGNLHISKNLDISGSIYNSNASGIVDVSGNLHISKNLDISGSIYNNASGNVDISGNLILHSQMSLASSSPGTMGTITWDSSYIYICTASGAWGRVDLSLNW